jgi:adenosylcobinamide-GDP ribazoletransferase
MRERVAVRVADVLAAFLLAISFLTVLPVPSPQSPRADTFGRAVACFPLVGTMLGCTVALVDALGCAVLARPVVTVLDLLAFIGLTGALHLDGLMDSCDGLFGGRDREQRLAIMRDSRVGSFGVAAGVLVLLLEYATLAPSTGQSRSTALLLAPTVGRWAMAVTLWVFPYSRTEGRGTAFKAGLHRQHVLLASIWTTGSVALLHASSLWLLPVLLVLALAMGRWIVTRIDGLTGDSYGAISEIITALTCVVLVGRRS